MDISRHNLGDLTGDAKHGASVSREEVIDKKKLTVQVGKGGMLNAGGTAGKLNPKLFRVLPLVISPRGSVVWPDTLL